MFRADIELALGSDARAQILRECGLLRGGSMRVCEAWRYSERPERYGIGDVPAGARLDTHVNVAQKLAPIITLSAEWSAAGTIPKHELLPQALYFFALVRFASQVEEEDHKMPKTRISSLASLMLISTTTALLSFTAQAQTSPTLGTVMLKEGTQVKSRFVEAFSSKTAVLDDPVPLELSEDLKLGGVFVARTGAKAVATVSNVKKAGMMGKVGELNIRLESFKAGETKVQLRGTKGREGDSNVGTAVALTVLFGPVGLIKHGKNIDIAAGTAITTYVADDTSLPPAN